MFSKAFKSKVIAMSLVSAWGGAFAQQTTDNCALRIGICPGDFSSSTIIVPADVKFLDPLVPICKDSVTIGPPPSVVFIIDQSGSMSTNDAQNRRFAVTVDAIDRLFALSPGTEVGLSIFSFRLSFDIRDGGLFQPAIAGQPDAYVPLIALNKVFDNGRTGIDTLKSLLRHANGNMVFATTQPAPRAPFATGTRGGTDISLGFQGAVAAMAKAKATRDNQFFIFLSDGLPSGQDSGRTDSATVNFWRDQTASFPTTLTVFFTPPGGAQTAPQDIITMTTNVQNNNYSTSNPTSAFFAVSSNLLGDRIQQELLSRIKTLPTVPVGASITVGGVTANGQVRDTNFIFSKGIALSDSVMVIVLKYTYTYTDTTGGQNVKKEQVRTHTLTVRKVLNATLPPNSGLSIDCPDRVLLGRHNDFSRVDAVGASTASNANQWVLVTGANIGVNLLPGYNSTFKIWPGNMTGEDSLRFVGVRIDATREFDVEVKVFTNTGVLVNKTGFSLDSTNFKSLPLGRAPRTRTMKVLWPNRSSDGQLAGTGGYVIKTNVTLHGRNNPDIIATDVRRTGLLRKQ